MGIIIAIITSGWYFLQPPSRESQTNRQIRIFSVFDISFPNSSTDEHPGILAPDFSLTDLSGNVSWLSDFRGKVVVIGFKATWCGACRSQMPYYGTLWEEYPDEIVLMSIIIDPKESEETVSAFAQEFPYATWIWVRDQANLAQAYMVSLIPKTVIIDQDGYIRFTHTGVTSSSTFIQEIYQLLNWAH